MNKSKKFKLVKWLALSDVKTNYSIKMNNKTYYINEKGEHYDIYAEDRNNAKLITKYNSKLLFLISEYQFNFAAGTDDNFYFAFVKDVRSNPQILWLKKNNPL